METNGRFLREIVHVEFRKSTGCGGEWIVARAGGGSWQTILGLTKRQIVATVAAAARLRWKRDGVATRLVVHKRRGGLDFVRRYGAAWRARRGDFAAPTTA